jgi:hypothetical protein
MAALIRYGIEHHISESIASVPPQADDAAQSAM